jgi:hypothetical protein
MYTDMDEWTEIRKRVLIGGESQRAILRETGMHCKRGFDSPQFEAA